VVPEKQNFPPVTSITVPVSAINAPETFLIFSDSPRNITASAIVKTGPEDWIIELTDAVVYFIPMFWKMFGSAMAKTPMPVKTSQFFLE